MILRDTDSHYKHFVYRLRTRNHLRKVIAMFELSWNGEYSESVTGYIRPRYSRFMTVDHHKRMLGIHLDKRLGFEVAQLIMWV